MEKGGKLLAYLDRFWITKHHQKKGIEACEGMFYTYVYMSSSLPLLNTQKPNSAVHTGVMFISELVPLIWRQRVLLRDISVLIQRAFNAVVADLRDDPAGPSPEHLDVLRVGLLMDSVRSACGMYDIVSLILIRICRPARFLTCIGCGGIFRGVGPYPGTVEPCGLLQGATPRSSASGSLCALRRKVGLCGWASSLARSAAFPLFLFLSPLPLPTHMNPFPLFFLMAFVRAYVCRPCCRAATFARQVSAGQVDEAMVADYIRVVQRCIQAEEAIWEPVYPR